MDFSDLGPKSSAKSGGFDFSDLGPSGTIHADNTFDPQTAPVVRPGFAQMASNTASKFIPPIIGGMAGSAAAAPYGAPFGPLGVGLAGLGGAYVGAMGARIGQREIEQGINQVSPGQFPQQNQSQILAEGNQTGKAQAIGEAGGQIVSGGPLSLVGRAAPYLPGIVGQYAQVMTGVPQRFGANLARNPGDVAAADPSAASSIYDEGVGGLKSLRDVIQEEHGPQPSLRDPVYGIVPGAPSGSVSGQQAIQTGENNLGGGIGSTFNAPGTGGVLPDSRRDLGGGLGSTFTSGKVAGAKTPGESESSSYLTPAELEKEISKKFNNAYAKAKAGRLDDQEALTGLQASNYLQRSLAAKPTESAARNFSNVLVEGENAFRSHLTDSGIDIGPIGQGYFNALTKKAFSSGFPLNKNGSPNALRSFSAVAASLDAAASAAAGKEWTVPRLMAAGFVSPYANYLGIQAAARMAPLVPPTLNAGARAAAQDLWGEYQAQQPRNPAPPLAPR